MDGRGRALDNVFVERLWRTIKYEEIYLKDYVDGWDAEASLAAYLRFYCDERIHQSLGYRTAGHGLRRPLEKITQVARNKSGGSCRIENQLAVLRPRETFEGFAGR